MKKVIIIIVCILIIGALGFTGFYFWGISPRSSLNNPREFTIEAAKKLQDEGFIRSSLALSIYLFFNDYNIQAGEYELSEDMTPKAMLEKFANGDILIRSKKVTLIEGERLTDYAEVLSKSLGFSKDEFLEKVNDLDYLTSLIESGDYWFLTDSILNDQLYYPLEGYLFPNTYEFLETATIDDVVRTILNTTKDQLEPLKDVILNSTHSIHDIMTMASIIEKEANTESDRKTVSQVFYTRLSENWSLGSDVTAFYGARKEMGKDSETYDVLYDVNPYNTRLTDGQMNGKLPIGPICSPSIISINAAIYPSDTAFYYFVANTCNGEVSFLTTADEFYLKTTELSKNGCL